MHSTRTGLVRQLTLAFVAIVAFSISAQATAITFTGTVVGTGRLGNSPFTNAEVTVIMSADTASLTNDGGGLLYYTGGITTVSVAGVGSATFTDNVQAFENQGFSGGIAGFGIVNFGTLLGTFNSFFHSYDMVTTMGPEYGDSFIRPDLTFATDAGLFLLADTLGESSLEAVTDGGVTTPEPSTFALAGFAGLATLSYVRSRRKAANA